MTDRDRFYAVVEEVQEYIETDYVVSPTDALAALREACELYDRAVPKTDYCEPDDSDVPDGYVPPYVYFKPIPVTFDGGTDWLWPATHYKDWVDEIVVAQGGAYL